MKHLDELIHDLRIEAHYMEADVDVDEIVDMKAFQRRLANIEECLERIKSKCPQV